MQISQAVANAMLGTLDGYANGGTLVVFGGSVPTTVEGAVATTGNLATLTFQSTAFSAAAFASGYSSATAAFVAASVAPSASGTATYAAAFTSAGTPFALYTVGTSGADLNLGSLTISTGTNLDVTSFVHKLAGS